MVNSIKEDSELEYNKEKPAFSFKVGSLDVDSYFDNDMMKMINKTASQYVDEEVADLNNDILTANAYRGQFDPIFNYEIIRQTKNGVWVGMDNTIRNTVEVR